MEVGTSGEALGTGLLERGIWGDSEEIFGRLWSGSGKDSDRAHGGECSAVIFISTDALVADHTSMNRFGRNMLKMIFEHFRTTKHTSKQILQNVFE